MANPYAAFRTDEDKERNGSFLVLGAFRIKVARAGGKNIKYSGLRDTLTKQHRRAIQLDTLPQKIQDALNAELAAKALVTGWEVDEHFGETDDNGGALEPNWIAGKMHDPANGEVVEFTPELAMKTFITYNDLYQQVAGHAADLENYLDREQIEEDVKN